MHTKKILFIIILLLVFISVDAGACDLFALIAKEGYTLSDLMVDSPDTNELKEQIYGSINAPYTNPYNYFLFLGKRSHWSRNNDGYGFIYFQKDKVVLDEYQKSHLVGNFKFYMTSPDTLPHEWRHPFHIAYDRIRQPASDAVAVLGHARSASSSMTKGNHPFWFEIDEDEDGDIDRTFTFEHNGSCGTLKPYIVNFLLENDPDWFDNHPLNWREYFDDPDEIDPNQIVDSELLFHFIMYHTMENNGDVISGIITAINKIYFNDRPLFTLNFILSDGEGLYIFRNYRINGADHNLEYKAYDGFVGVKTQDVEDSDHTDIQQYSIAHIPRNEATCGIPLNEDGVGELPQIIEGYKKNYVKGEITEDRVWEDGDFFIIGNTKIAENAKLTVTDNARIFFTGAHELEIESGEIDLKGELNLAYGAAVKIVGKDAALSLDWGSKITGRAEKYGYYLNRRDVPNEYKIVYGDRIIAKNGGKITTPEYYDETSDVIEISSANDMLWDGIQIVNPQGSYWFNNCDISGISELSVKYETFSEDPPKIIFENSSFHHAGSIIVRDGVILKINGCKIYDNNATPIMAFESQVILDRTEERMSYIHHNDGYGFFIKYGSETPSEIKNTLIHDNLRGVQFVEHTANLENAEIYNNHSHGILSEGASWLRLDQSLIQENSGAEYIGTYDSYDMAYGWNTIHDESYEFSNIPADKYIFVVTDYVDSVQTRPINLMENYIFSEDPERFYPSIGAFRLPDNIENDSFSRTISSQNEPQIHINQYLAANDYEKAIQALEHRIQTITSEDKRLRAMIHQAYFYLKLAESGVDARALPQYCSVKTPTFDAYLQKVEELESRLSYNFSPDKKYPPIQAVQPAAFQLGNYPNPFNPSTSIEFYLQQPSNVTLAIYDVSGKLITVLIQDDLSDGHHSVHWNGRDAHDRSVPSGIYVAKIENRYGKRETHKILLLK